MPLLLLAALLHEGGHLLALKLMGGKMDQLRLTLFGACIQVSPEPALTCIKEAILCLAGPAVNLLVAAICAWIQSGGYDTTLFLGCNLLTGGFNLLPASPFDGGQALFALLIRFSTVDRAELLLYRLTQLTALFFLIMGVLLFWKTGYNLTVLLCAGVLTGALGIQLHIGKQRCPAYV